MGSILQLTFFDHGRLPDSAFLPQKRLPGQDPIYFGDKLTDGRSIKENQVRFHRQVASFRRPVHRGADQPMIHHRHHEHKGLHKIQPAFLSSFKNRDFLLRFRHRNHFRHTTSLGVNDIIHAGMCVLHLPYGTDQVLRADSLRCPGKIRGGIGFFAASGQALQGRKVFPFNFMFRLPLSQLQ